VAFNGESLSKFGPQVRRGGIVLYDSSVVSQAPSLDGVRVVGIPFTRIASDLGSLRVKNIIALGAFQRLTQLFPEESFLSALRRAFHPSAGSGLTVNEAAFFQGGRALAEVGS
jgi:Pyruvate/2-oxoacid:ferredoxin oxidoreductase gamma subunit